jgi:thioesterase domain-containing protein
VLVTVQMMGTGVPLFIVHGVAGIMTLSSTIARALGPDQPLYIFHTNGMEVNIMHEHWRSW